MNTLGKLTLAFAVGLGSGYWVAPTTKYQDLNDCLWEASKRPTDVGTGLAASVCRAAAANKPVYRDE